MAGELIRRVRFLITGDPADLLASYEEAKKATTETTDEIGHKFSKLGAHIAKTFAKVDESLADMGVETGGVLSATGRKFDEMDSKTKTFGASLAGLGKTMLMGIGAGAATAGFLSIKAAMANQTAVASLQASVEAAHLSWRKYNAEAQKAVDNAANLGFTAPQVESALSSGMVATQSMAKSTHNLGVAMDLARMKGIPLATFVRSSSSASTSTWSLRARRTCTTRTSRSSRHSRSSTTSC